MLVLLDEPTLLLFDRPEHLHGWIEAVDVEAEAYRFCGDDGQRYRGVVTRRVGGRPDGWALGFRLEPVGEPDVTHALALIDRAVLLDEKPAAPAGRPRFADLDALRRHLSGPREG